MDERGRHGTNLSEGLKERLPRSTMNQHADIVKTQHVYCGNEV